MADGPKIVVSLEGLSLGGTANVEVSWTAIGLPGKVHALTIPPNATVLLDPFTPPRLAPSERASTAEPAEQHATPLPIEPASPEPPLPATLAPNQWRWAPGEADRVALHPIRHDDIWALYKRLEGLHWTAQDIDLTPDRADWRRMPPDQQQFVRFQLAFFARVDIDVLANVDRLADEVGCLEAKFFYAAQAAQECVHAEAYSLQVAAVLEGAEREATLNAVRTIPVVGRMRAWALARLDPAARPLADRLAAAAAVEGVLFSSSFAALQWLRSLNLLPGVTGFNAYIARDEWVHTQHSCLLIRRYLRSPPTDATVHDILREVVDLLDEFIAEALPAPLPGMNADLMRQYVRFVADCLLLELEYPLLFGAANPFRFMESFLLNDVSKTNFYERENPQYQSPASAEASRLAIDESPVE